MIEFNGYLTGSAEKQYWKNVRKFAYKILLFVIIGMIPVSVYISLIFGFWQISIMVGILLFLLLFLFLLPKTKNKNTMLPKRIFTDGEMITCIAEKYADNKMLSDVKQVYEYDEYYNLVVRGGSGFFMYVCQKDLIEKGTLAEFEALFEGKITDMKKQSE